MYQRVGFISIMCAATTAVAEPVPMTGKSISEAVLSGATVQLDTPLGTKLPVKYASNGIISGEAGALSWFLGSATDRGRWWVAEDKLCHKWFKWFDAEVQCLRIKRDGERLFWSRDDGKTGTATLIPAPPLEQAPFALGNQMVSADAPVPVTAAANPDAAAGAQSEAQHPTAAKAVPPKIPAPQKQVAMSPKAAPVVVAAVVVTKPPVAPALPKQVRLAAVAVAPAVTAPVAKAPVKPAAVAVVPTPEPTRVEAYLFRVSRVQPNDVLNVRQGPSSDAATVGFIPPSGQGVRLAGACQMEWCPVTHGRVTGWVNSFYLIRE